MNIGAVGGPEILLLQRFASASQAALAAQSVRAVHWSWHRQRESPRGNTVEIAVTRCSSGDFFSIPPWGEGDRPKVVHRVIVYKLDTLRHKARHGLEQLSLVIFCSCASKSQTTTTEQCRVAAGSTWDGQGGRKALDIAVEPDPMAPSPPPRPSPARGEGVQSS